MPRNFWSAPQVVGAIVGSIGSLLMLDWALAPQWVGLLIPSAPMVSPVTRCLLVTTAISFFVGTRPQAGAGWALASRMCSAVLVLVPLLAFAESLLSLFTGVNVVSTGIAAAIDNRELGRQSPNAGLAFVCAGLAFWLARRAMSRPQRALYLLLVVVVAAIGLGGLLGYLLGLESLYRIARFNRLLPITAFALAVVSAGLWALYEQTLEFDAEKSEARTTRRTGVVITLVTLGAGAAGFGLMRENFEQVVSQNMLLTARTTATSLAHAIDTSLALPRLVATRPGLGQRLAAVDEQPQDGKARQALQALAETFVGADISSVRLYSSRGEMLVQAGSSLSAQARVLHPLANTGQNAALAWHQGYLLFTASDVAQQGRPVGRVLIEQRLPLFDRLLSQVRSLNESSDSAVCSRTGANAICGPTRFRPQVFTIPMFNSAGAPALPVVHAVLGASGVLRAQDLRGIAVVSGYAPLKDFGLGLAVKVDVDTLYAPLRGQLKTLALWLLVIIALAVYAQSSQVRPLIRQVIASKLRLRAILNEQSELVSLAKPDGELSYVNPAYARAHGWTTETAIGHNLLEGVDPADREAVQAQIAEVLRSGKPAMNENRLFSSDGQLHWVAWTNSVQKEPSGELLLHSVGRDITERKLAEVALRELTTIFDNTTDFVVQTDRHGRVTYMNPAARAALNITAGEDVSPQMHNDFHTPETRRLFDEVIVPTIRSQGVWTGETTVYAAGKRVLPVSHMVIAHRGEDGRISRYSAIMRDISQQIEIKQQQQRQASTLQSITEAFPAMVAVVGTDGHYRFANRVFERWSGISRDAIIGRHMREVLGSEEYERSRPWVEKVLAGQTVTFEKDYIGRALARHMAISYIPLWLDQQVDGFVAVALDITQHKQEEVRLQQLARRDPLTGLLNRAGFEQYLESQMPSEHGAQQLALLYIDLDHFKPVNDTHGHRVGDQVLQLFAARLQQSVRPSDAVARLGGDEFAIALTGVRTLAAARGVADKVIAAGQQPFAVGDLTLTIGASVGIAFEQHQATWQALMALADEQLYRAKAAGRGRHASGSDGMRGSADGAAA